MQADAQQGLSRAARIESTKQLQFAQAKQNRRNANFKTFTNLASGLIEKDKNNAGGFFGSNSYMNPAPKQETQEELNTVAGDS